MSEPATVKFRASRQLRMDYVLDGVTGEQLGIVWRARDGRWWAWVSSIERGRSGIAAKSRRAATLDLLSSLPDAVRERNRVR